VTEKAEPVESRPLGAAFTWSPLVAIIRRCEGSPRASRLRTIGVAYVRNKERSGGTLIYVDQFDPF
jgi:hypothetical protein